MEFETLKKDNRKKWIVGVIAILAIASAIFFVSTRANYKTTQRLNLINTKVNWNPTDLEIVSIKIKDGDSYTDTNTVPTSGYTLSSESYCEVNGNKDTSIPMEYKDGKVSVGISKKGTKCYLIFEKSTCKSEFCNQILASNGGESAIKAKGNPDFSKTSCTSGVYNGTSRTCGEDTTGMWAMEDDYGISYYFRGTPTNNYVKFGKYASNYSDSTLAGKDMYWRIIRINGDGTIRLIYDGTEYHVNGTSTNNSIIRVNNSYYVKFNALANNNAYIGYTYGTGSKRGIGSDSNIKTATDNWYTNSGLSSYISYLADSGFCGDRTSTTSNGVPNNTGGTGTTFTYYGAYYRLASNKMPTLKCSTITYGNDKSYEKGNKADVYTVNTTKGNGQLQYPIGLINADEVAVAGGVANAYNYAYYLNNRQYYYTMTPADGSSMSSMFSVFNGRINVNYVNGSDTSSSLRPVINLDPTKINNVTIDSDGVYVVS